MYISNVKVLAIPYLVIIYWLVIAGILGYSTRMATEAMLNKKLEPPATTSIGSVQKAKNVTPSIIELFTSEGCSSCPPADRLVAKAQKEFNDRTIVLSYHVDYWNNLGWKDRFSKKEFSDRQAEYAQHLHLESVYTPQAIVNGTTQFVGSDEGTLWKAIKSYSRESNDDISIETAAIAHNKLLVKYNDTSIGNNEELIVALVLKNAVTNVQRGENSGSTLYHINVVEAISHEHDKSGIADFDLPAGFLKENYILVAFVQNKKSLEITNALKIDIL
jgi:hypothetical protein